MRENAFNSFQVRRTLPGMEVAAAFKALRPSEEKTGIAETWTGDEGRKIWSDKDVGSPADEV